MVSLHKSYRNERLTFTFCFSPLILYLHLSKSKCSCSSPSLLLSSIPWHVNTTFCLSSCRWTSWCFSFFPVSSATVSFLVDARECFSGSRRFCFNKHCQIALCGSQATWVTDTSEFPFPPASPSWIIKALILPVCWEETPPCHSHRLPIGKGWALLSV